MPVSRRNALKLLLASSATPSRRVAAATLADDPASTRWNGVLRQYATATRYIDHARGEVHGPMITGKGKGEDWIAYDANSGFCVQFAVGKEISGAVIIEKDRYQQWSAIRGWKSLQSFSVAMNGAIRGSSVLTAMRSYFIASLLLAGRSEDVLGLANLSKVACASDAKDCSAITGILDEGKSGLGERKVALTLTDGSRITEIENERDGYKGVAQIDGRFDIPFDWKSVADAIRRNPDELAIPSVNQTLGI